MKNIIPYDFWINSPLSIARYYGGIEMNGKHYVVAYMFAKEDENWICKPDLIETDTFAKMMKERPDEVLAYKEECQKRTKKQQNTISLF
jgi:hypothetical protein